MSIPHEMTRTNTVEHGVEIWSCAQCGRRLLFRWPPAAFGKLVLDPGDELATHVGGGGSGPGALPAEERGWLAAHGIEWDPDDTPESD